MATFRCKCGHSWDITGSPEPGLWIAWQDDADEQIIEREIESAKLCEDFDKNAQRIAENDGFVADHRTLIYECVMCGRLAWYRGESGELEWFCQDEE